MASRDDDGKSKGAGGRTAPSARVLALRAELLYLRHELQALLDGLNAVNEVAPTSAVVTAVVPKTVLMHHGVRRE